MLLLIKGLGITNFNCYFNEVKFCDSFSVPADSISTYAQRFLIACQYFGTFNTHYIGVFNGSMVNDSMKCTLRFNSDREKPSVKANLVNYSQILE